MLIFSSDNGPLPTLDRRRAGGLRGAKDSLYEGGIREPFIVRWPGHAPAGLVNEETIFTAVDLFPTLCKVAGIKTLDARFDGVDLSSAFEGKKPTRKKAIFGSTAGTKASAIQKNTRASVAQMWRCVTASGSS